MTLKIKDKQIILTKLYWQFYIRRKLELKESLCWKRIPIRYFPWSGSGWPKKTGSGSATLDFSMNNATVPGTFMYTGTTSDSGAQNLCCWFWVDQKQASFIKNLQFKNFVSSSSAVHRIIASAKENPGLYVCLNRHTCICSLLPAVMLEIVQAASWQYIYV